MRRLNVLLAIRASFISKSWVRIASHATRRMMFTRLNWVNAANLVITKKIGRMRYSTMAVYLSLCSVHMQKWNARNATKRSFSVMHLPIVLHVTRKTMRQYINCGWVKSVSHATMHDHGKHGTSITISIPNSSLMAATRNLIATLAIKKRWMTILSFRVRALVVTKMTISIKVSLANYASAAM